MPDRPMGSEPPISDPYLLTSWNVTRVIPGAVPGAFVICRVPENGKLEPTVVGRADDDVASALRGKIPLYGDHYFAFIPTVTPLTAFNFECSMFHGWSPSDNTVHPVRTQGTDWVCPICGDDK